MFDLKESIEDVIRRSRAFAISMAILLVLPLSGEAAPLLHVKWENLSMVTGQTVRIFLPGGFIKGKAGNVESEALVVDVKTTSDRNAYPKGVLRVPREKLHRLEMQTKGKLYRILLTSLGTCVGVGGGFGAYLGIGGCDLLGGCRSHRPIAAGAAWVGLTAAGVAGGYFAGNAADKRWTTIEILP